MKLTGKDYYTAFAGIVLLILYILSGEFFLLLVLLAGLVPGYYFDKKSNLSYQQKTKLGLILGGIIGILYGLYINEFWYSLKLTAGVVTFAWCMLKLSKRL